MSLFLPMDDARKRYARLRADHEQQLLELDDGHRAQLQEVHRAYMRSRYESEEAFRGRLEAEGLVGDWWLR